MFQSTTSEADRGTVDLRALSRLDPSNRQVKSLLQLSKQVRLPPSDVGLVSPVPSPTQGRSRLAIGLLLRYGTGSPHTPQDIISERGSSSLHSTVISHNDTFSPPSTFTSEKIKSTGIEPSISSIGSRKIRRSPRRLRG